MYKLFLSISILFFPLLLSSQNWSLFRSNDEINFNEADIHTVRVDTVLVQNNDSIYVFNRILNDTVTLNTSYPPTYTIQNITKPNIFGDTVLIKNDTLFFRNHMQEQVILLPHLTSSNSWIFYRNSNTIISATIDSIYIDSINHQLDSVKRISFIVTDTSNIVKNHFLNSKELLITKNNGWFKTINFYNVPNNSSSYLYGNYFDREYRKVRKTKGDFYGYNISDESHFRIVKSSNISTGPLFDDFINRTVISKIISPNQDTIIYHFREIRENNGAVNPCPNFPPCWTRQTNYTTSFFSDTIVNPSEDAFNNLGYEVNVDTFNFSGINKYIAQTNKFMFLHDFYNVPYSDKLIVTPERKDFYFFYDTLFNSWHYPSLYVDYTPYYIEDIGIHSDYYNNQGGGFNAYKYQLIYFKHGNNTWGTPRIVTSLKKVEDPLRNKPLFYPNPTENEIFINLTNELDEISLYDLSGRILRTWNKQIRNINLNEYNTGIYLIQLKFMSGEVRREILLLNKSN